jgi:type I restriction enzyme M protein
VVLTGRDINSVARQVGWMNLTVQGLKADLGSRPVDSLRADDTPGGVFDVVFANPPFNLKPLGDDLGGYDPRWRYGVPPRNNANFAWVQHVVSKLSARGRAAMLLPDGATFTAGAAQRIREGLVVDEVLSAIVALPIGLFPHTGIKSSVWLFSREKPAARRGQVLFVNARELGFVVERRGRRRALSGGDIERIADTYRSWCGDSHRDREGWCRSVTVEEIADREFNLEVGCYISAPVADPAPQQVAELTRELYRHFAEAARLEAELRDILGEM